MLIIHLFVEQHRYANYFFPEEQFHNKWGEDTLYSKVNSGWRRLVILYITHGSSSETTKSKAKLKKDLCKRTTRRIGLARSSKEHNHHNSLLSSRDRNRLVYGANGQNKELPTFNFRREELCFPSLSRHRRTTNVNTSEWIVCIVDLALSSCVYSSTRVTGFAPFRL